jgi:DNA-binding transcriptional ArsR family regulator
MSRRDPDYVFDALGDRTRRRLVVQLGSLGAATPTQLAQHLPISRQAVSKHLDTLAEAGLVSFERHGRETVYRLTPERFTDAVSWIAQVGAEWDSRLAALRSQLRRKKT